MTLENLQEVQLIQDDHKKVGQGDLLTAVAEKREHLDQNPVLDQGTFDPVPEAFDLEASLLGP